MRRLRARALEFSLTPSFTTSLLWGHFTSVESQFKIELSDTVDQKHLGSIGTILKGCFNMKMGQQMARLREALSAKSDGLWPRRLVMKGEN